MAAPIGAVVRLSPIDWSGADAPPAEGDCLVSAGGSGYLVLTAHATRRPGRWRLVCLKVDPAETAVPGRWLHLRWYPRGRRSARPARHAS